MNPTAPRLGRDEPHSTKPKLLVIELWGMGDLVIATPFLRAAARKFDITLLAKPYAIELQDRLWPGIKIIPFTAPWTAFTGKYQLWHWPVKEIFRLRRSLAREHFEYGLSGRWDPRDHFLLRLIGVRHRLGFPRMGSSLFLTQGLPAPSPTAHHYDHWRIAGEALGLQLPSRENLPVVPRPPMDQILVHSGARLPARVWPLANYQEIVRRLRELGRMVQVVCDRDQLQWWQTAGESAVACPRTVGGLANMLEESGVFIGNCSGPGHLAAILGLPTFTLFGPSLHEWFSPLHPSAECFEGKSCPYKPCSDYCRFATPECLWTRSADEVWPRLQSFVEKNLPQLVH